MAILSPSFLFGAVVLFYLLSFVAFAILRIATGISIQRIGFKSLRRISYTSRDGVRLDIRGFGLSFHRPTFAQPTWLSIVVTELKVTLDLKALGNKPAKKRWSAWGNGTASRSHTPPRTPTKPTVDETEVDETEAEDTEEEQRSRTWQRLTQYKERIKRLHRQIQWIRLVDLVAVNSSLVIVEVGSPRCVGRVFFRCRSAESFLQSATIS